MKELFAEFQHWLLPDEGLPPGLVDSTTVKAISSLPDDESSRIRSLQDPKRLRQYMELDPSEFLTMLYDAISLKGENPAAELLSELLMYHKGDLLDDGKPLLNTEQEKSCFFVLKRLNSFSDSEKLTLISHRRHREEVRELRYENAVLRKQVDGSKAKIEELEAKFNALSQLFLKFSAIGDAMSATPPLSGPSLFQPAPKR
jgi:hypothetical protein